MVTGFRQGSFECSIGLNNSVSRKWTAVSGSAGEAIWEYRLPRRQHSTSCSTDLPWMLLRLLGS